MVPSERPENEVKITLLASLGCLHCCPYVDPDQQGDNSHGLISKKSIMDNRCLQSLLWIIPDYMIDPHIILIILIINSLCTTDYRY